MPIDPHRELPMRDYQAHLAIIEGKKKKRKKERRQMEKDQPN